MFSLDFTARDSRMQPLWVIPGAACEASQAATKRHLPEPAGETQGRRYQSTISGPHCSTSKLNWLIQPFPFAFEFCFSTSCSKGWFTGKFSTIPTNPQVERVFKGIESGLSELTLGITAGLRKYFQKSISLKAANAFWLFFFFFIYMRSDFWPQLNKTVLLLCPLWLSFLTPQWCSAVNCLRMICFPWHKPFLYPKTVNPATLTLFLEAKEKTL